MVKRPESSEQNAGEEAHASHATASPRSGVAGWAKRQQAEKEAAMSPTERILLALRLGLRAKALRAAVRR